jgi:hypothetical protein
MERLDTEASRRCAAMPLGLVLVVLCTSCHETASRQVSQTAVSPSSPTVVTPTPAPDYPNFTLTGIISDSASGLPLSGYQVDVESASVVGKPWWVVRTPSDQAGRYVTYGIPIFNETGWIIMTRSPSATSPIDYYQQCAVPIVLNGNTTTIDVQITRRGDLSTTGPPPGIRPTGRTVSGVVFRVVDGVWQPVVADVAADVAADVSHPVIAAQTITDASGHYLLCGMPRTQLRVGADSDPAGSGGATINAGSDAVVDIEVK